MSVKGSAKVTGVIAGWPLLKKEVEKGEIQVAVMKLKLVGRAPGTGDITVEMLKNEGVMTVGWMMWLCIFVLKIGANLVATF